MLIDTLESRTLFSAPGIAVPTLPKNAGPKTTAAYTAAKSASAKLVTAGSTLAVDAKTYAKAVATLLKSPTSAISADLAAVKADKSSVSAQAKADAQAIVTEGKVAAAAFSSGNFTAVIAAEGVLQTDIAKLKADASTGASTIASDATKLLNDVNANSTIAPLYIKLQAAQTAFAADQTTFNADLKIYQTDLKQNPKA